MPTQPEQQNVSVKFKAEEEATRLLIAQFTKQLAGLHDQYFQLQGQVSNEAGEAKKMIVAAIRKTENIISDLKSKLPNKVW